MDVCRTSVLAPLIPKVTLPLEAAFLEAQSYFWMLSNNIMLNNQYGPWHWQQPPQKKQIRASLIFVCSALPVSYRFFIHSENSWQSRPVLLDFMQLELWFLEHFSDGKGSLNSPDSPSLDTGVHPTSLPVLRQSQRFMQLCGKMFQGAGLGGEKRNLKKKKNSILITSVVHQEATWTLLLA